MDRAFSFAEDGAQPFSRALDEGALGRLEAAIAVADTGKPGARLGAELAVVADLLAASGPIGGISARLGGTPMRPVRATLFDKHADGNWALGLHQDRTIAVSERREVPGFGPWTVKAGRVHVEPPFEIIADMITLRVHLDAVDAGNAPLLVLPGSHRLGRLTEEAISRLDASAAVPCFAGRGDIWAYRTPILHGSGPVHNARGRRRVLQLDYAAGDLPGGLNWAGLAAL